MVEFACKQGTALLLWYFEVFLSTAKRILQMSHIFIFYYSYQICFCQMQCLFSQFDGWSLSTSLFQVFYVFARGIPSFSHKHCYIQDAVLLLGYHHKHDEIEQKPWIPKQAASIPRFSHKNI